MCSVFEFLATLCQVKTLFNVELHYDLAWQVLGNWLDERGGTMFRIPAKTQILLWGSPMLLLNSCWALFPSAWIYQGLKLTSNLQLQWKLRMNGAVPLLPLTPSWLPLGWFYLWTKEDRRDRMTSFTKLERLRKAAVNFIMTYLLTAIELSLDGSSPYTSTDETNKTK